METLRRARGNIKFKDKEKEQKIMMKK